MLEEPLSVIPQSSSSETCEERKLRKPRGGMNLKLEPFVSCDGTYRQAADAHLILMQMAPRVRRVQLVLWGWGGEFFKKDLEGKMYVRNMEGQRSHLQGIKMFS